MAFVMLLLIRVIEVTVGLTTADWMFSKTKSSKK